MQLKQTVMTAATTVALGATGAIGITFSTVAPASAAACGYSLQNETTPDSNFHWDLPVIGEIDLGGGGATVTVGHYGNCSNSNEKISVERNDGNRELCVTPGDTRLGISAESNGPVTGATKIGTC